MCSCSHFLVLGDSCCRKMGKRALSESTFRYTCQAVREQERGLTFNVFSDVRKAHSLERSKSSTPRCRDTGNEMNLRNRVGRSASVYGDRSSRALLDSNAALARYILFLL